MLKDSTRQAIRERRQAGESTASLADEFLVPDDFIVALCSWQIGRDEHPPEPKFLGGTCPHCAGFFSVKML